MSQMGEGSGTLVVEEAHRCHPCLFDGTIREGFTPGSERSHCQVLPCPFSSTICRLEGQAG